MIPFWWVQKGTSDAYNMQWSHVTQDGIKIRLTNETPLEKNEALIVQKEEANDEDTGDHAGDASQPKKKAKKTK